MATGGDAGVQTCTPPGSLRGRQTHHVADSKLALLLLARGPAWRCERYGTGEGAIQVTWRRVCVDGPFAGAGVAQEREGEPGAARQSAAVQGVKGKGTLRWRA